MEEEFQLDKSLKKIEYRWTGMNLESSRKTRSENFKYKLLYIFNFIWLNIDVVGTCSWFVDSAMKGASFTSLTYVAPCITMCFLANTKSISILVYEDDINQILSILRNLEVAHKRREKISEKEEIIAKETGFLSSVLNILNFFNWTLIILFPLTALGLTALEYYSTGNIELKLPFLVLYPFDAYDIKYWPIAYLRQVWDTVLVVIFLCGVDYLFFVCIAFICIQFKLLQYDMRTFITADGITGTVQCNDDELRAKFVELVKRHQELINAVDLLEKIYSISTFLNFGVSCLLICLSLFDVLTIDDKPYVVSFASFLFASLLQIFSLCYFGDMLMLSSIKVSDAIFESMWYLNKTSVMKDMNTIIMRAQKPCKITAYGFAEVNLNAFTRILSTSWSYFALLNTVYSSPK